MVFKTIFIESETKLNIDFYVKSIDDDKYINCNLEKLLPDWLEPPQTIIFIFFQCKFCLDGSNLEEEQIEKNRLLSKFSQLGSSFYNACKNQRIISEIICPKDGFPQYSRKGTDIFSIQAIVTRHLPQFKKENNRCGLIHPDWDKAVYPCLMLSLAEEEQITPIIWNISHKMGLIRKKTN